MLCLSLTTVVLWSFLATETGIAEPVADTVEKLCLYKPLLSMELL
jgi:hypothetical protein